MLSTRLMATLCALTLISATACAPQSVTPQVNAPGQSDAVQLEDDVTMDLILTEEVEGVENPITPEQIESVEVDGEVVSTREIDVETGAFTTAQAKDSKKLSVKARAVKKGGKALPILRIKKTKTLQAASARDVKIKFKSRLGQSRTIQLLRLKALRDLEKQRMLRILAKQNGEVVGGASDDDGQLDPRVLRFKMNLKNRFELLKERQKLVFNPDTPLPEDGEAQEESSAPVTDEETQEFEVQSISPIAAFVGKWRANLLGKSILASLSDEGNGRIGGTATVDGQSFSAAAEYTLSEDTPDTLQVAAQSPTGTALTFEASVQEQNTLTLKLVDAGNDPQITPFLNIPVALKRDF